MATQAELRAAMERLRGKLESLMELMQTVLHTEPVPTLSLQRKLGKAETIWKEIEGYYDHLCTMTDEDLAEVDRIAFTDFQHRYTNLCGRVEDALEEHRSKEEAREQARLKVIKVQQLNAKWNAVHQHIETTLQEIKTRLEGDPIDNVELLQVKSNQLMAV